jgi:DNA processing protein
VTDADEVNELAGLSGSATTPGELAADAGARRATDDLEPVARLVLDALPRRTGAEVERVASAAGVSASEASAALGLLELDGWVVRRGNKWLLGRMSDSFQTQMSSRRADTGSVRLQGESPSG